MTTETLLTESKQSQGSIATLDDVRQRELIRTGKAKNVNVKLRIPKRFLGKSLDNFRAHRELLDEAIGAILDGTGVFIIGKCGTGKTHLALALMLHYWAKKWPDLNCLPTFIPSVEFFLELKNTFDSSQAEADVLHKYSSAPLLIFDDVGAERISEWSKQEFYLVIDRRYRDMRNTIITSNLSLDQISKTFDDRVASRIAEMCKIIELNGPDQRLT